MQNSTTNSYLLFASESNKILFLKFGVSAVPQINLLQLTGVWEKKPQDQ